MVFSGTTHNQMHVGQTDCNTLQLSKQLENSIFLACNLDPDSQTGTFAKKELLILLE